MAYFSNKSFTAVNTFGTPVLLKNGQKFYYTVSGTFVATVRLEKSEDAGATWDAISNFTAASSGYVVANFSTGNKDALIRFSCVSFTSGTVVTTIQTANIGTKQIHGCGASSKVGATAGWVVAGTTDVCLATLPASQTASTLIVPVRGLKVGDRINGFNLIGQIESAGNAVTVDASLKKTTAAAADVVEAAVGTMTQLSVTADAAMSDLNTSSLPMSVVVGDGETYYFLITATTGASTDIALQGVVLFVEA